MKRYVTKAELSRSFCMSPPAVYQRVAGIEEEMQKGRYNRYAIADGLISVAVFIDYCKYRKALNDKNARKYVPAFNRELASEYLGIEEAIT